MKINIDDFLSFFLIIFTERINTLGPDYIEEKYNRYIGIDISNIEIKLTDSEKFHLKSYTKTQCRNWINLDKFKKNRNIIELLFKFRDLELDLEEFLLKFEKEIKQDIDFYFEKSSTGLHKKLENYKKEYYNIPKNKRYLNLIKLGV